MFKSIISLLSLTFTLSSFAASPIDFMTFPDSFECNEKFPHYSFCDAVEFKPWTEAEKDKIKSILKEIDRPELANFYKTIQEKGIKEKNFTKFYRVTYSSTLIPNSKMRRAEFIRKNENTLIWVNPVTNVIGITDNFFGSNNFIDPYTKLPRDTHAILHELAHVFDIAQKHISSEIKSDLGWSWDGKNDFIRDIDYQKSQDEFKEILVYIEQDNTNKTYYEDRIRGIKYGYPTLYSMTNSHECFAELITYYVLDPKAKEYMSQDIQTKLKEILQIN
jgi:hypothetical protein